MEQRVTMSGKVMVGAIAVFAAGGLFLIYGGRANDEAGSPAGVESDVYATAEGSPVAAARIKVYKTPT